MTANIIAGLSLILSISLAGFYFRDRRHAKYLLESEYTNNLLHWHEKTTNILIKLNIKNRERSSEEYQQDLAILSALIEQGRFYFPNIDRADNYGHEKPPAYRGFRNLVLDFLVASYNLFKDPDNTPHLTEQANKLQRHFTSIVFEIINPKDRLAKIRELTDRYFIQEKSFEDFLKKDDSSVLEYIWDQPTRHNKVLKRDAEKTGAP